MSLKIHHHIETKLKAFTLTLLKSLNKTFGLLENSKPDLEYKTLAFVYIN